MGHHLIAKKPAGLKGWRRGFEAQTRPRDTETSRDPARAVKEPEEWRPQNVCLREHV